MTSRRRLLVALPALAGAPLAAWAAETVVGSGRVAREKRTPGSFDAIGLDGEARVVLTPAEHESVEVEADDNILPLIETVVREGGKRGGRSLRIGLRRGARVSVRTPIVVQIGFVSLGSVALGGGGSITGAGFRGGPFEASLGGSGSIVLTAVEAPEVQVSIGGSGSVRLAGRSGRLSVAIGGSGDADTGGLAADDVSVSIGGSGDARVRAERSLDVTIAGSGSVVHSGAATPHSTIVGSGRIRRA